MKNVYSSLLRILFFIVLFFGAASVANAQIVNIPDANFKVALVGDLAINTNADGEIQVSEAVAYGGTINVASSGISDLTGIEAFTSIEELNCLGNALTSLNVSNNLQLTNLICS